MHACVAQDLRQPRSSRPARPPRRWRSNPARVGSAVMMARRSSALIRDQVVISSMLRRQPVQSRASGWITQTLMQGLSISSRRQILSVTGRPLMVSVSRHVIVSGRPVHDRAP